MTALGTQTLDKEELFGVRPLALQAIRQETSRINTRHRSEALTRMAYEKAAKKYRA